MESFQILKYKYKYTRYFIMLRRYTFYRVYFKLNRLKKKYM